MIWKRMHSIVSNCAVQATRGIATLPNGGIRGSVLFLRKARFRISSARKNSYVFLEFRKALRILETKKISPCPNFRPVLSTLPSPPRGGLWSQKLRLNHQMKLVLPWNLSAKTTGSHSLRSPGTSVIPMRMRATRSRNSSAGLFIPEDLPG